MTAQQVLQMGEDQGADCCAIYNLLLDNGHDEVAEKFEGLDGKPTKAEMDEAYSLADEIDGALKAEAAFDERHGLNA